ncbi:tetratricopeptide repeat protein [Alkalicaulis satelles]|nr:tetratricopeptide repeat protein [Alkalicaulis satelles]
MGWMIMLGAALSLGMAAPDDEALAAAIAAYEAGQAQTAEPVIRAHAEAGAAHAQFYLGRMLARGELGAPDMPQAARWFRAAAEQGEPRAQNNLAVMLWSGAGVAQDRAEAETLWRVAAEQGVMQAHFNLAVHHQSGELSTGRDLAASRRHFQAASEAGMREATHEYARMMGAGLGGETDRAGAAALFRPLAEDGYVPSMTSLGLLYGLGIEGEPDRESERFWLTRAWEAGRDARAAYILGTHARGSEGMDPDASVSWLFRAIRSGEPASAAAEARAALLLVFEGAYREPDVWDPDIIAWLESEAYGGARDALIALARAHGAGRGVDHDEARGRALLIGAVQADRDAQAMYHLGRLYAEQQSGDDWRERSWMWFELARRHDYAQTAFSRAVASALRLAHARLETDERRRQAQALADACQRSGYARCQ